MPAVASLAITVLVVLRLARLVVERERTPHELQAHAEQQAGLARLGDLALSEVAMEELSAAAVAALRIPLHGTATMSLVVDLPDPTETDRLFLAAVANTLGSAARQRTTEAALLHQTRHDPSDRAAELEAPFDLPEHATVGASIGLARARPDDDPDSLLRRADAAMYRAKATRATRRPRGPTPAH